MIIGSGLIANSFKDFKNNDNVIIFASGVSNSKETDEKQFQRERDLIISFIPTNKQFVYFSTCSVFDKSLGDSKYINHKRDMEFLIRNRFENHIIFRLPNVIGKTDNKNTSFNYFVEKIKNGEEIKIQKNAVRYLIDAESLEYLLKPFIAFYNTSHPTSNDSPLNNESSKAKINRSPLSHLTSEDQILTASHPTSNDSPLNNGSSKREINRGSLSHPASEGTIPTESHPTSNDSPLNNGSSKAEIIPDSLSHPTSNDSPLNNGSSKREINRSSLSHLTSEEQILTASHPTSNDSPLYNSSNDPDSLSHSTIKHPYSTTNQPQFNPIPPRTINVCFNNKITVLEYVELIERVLNKKTKKIVVDGGFNCAVDNSEFMRSIMFRADYRPDEDYNLNIIRKHI